MLGLHGLASSGQMLQSALAPLAEGGFRVLLPDLLGHGASPWPAGLPYDVEDHLAALQAWTDLVVGAEPVWLVGYSLGALLALAWAAREPRRVRGVVAISTPLFDSPTEARAYLSRDAMGWGLVYTPSLTKRLCQSICGQDGPARRFCSLPQFHPLLGWTMFHAFGLAKSGAVSSLETLPVVKTRILTGLALCWLHSWESLYGSFQRCIVEHSAWPYLQLLRAAPIPVLFLHGDSDALAPVHQVCKAALIGGWQIQVYRAGTHALPITHPRALHVEMLPFFRAADSPSCCPPDFTNQAIFRYDCAE